MAGPRPTLSRPTSPEPGGVSIQFPEPEQLVFPERPAAATDPDRDEGDTPDQDQEGGTRGDTANYDFPAKREWRSFWANYIRGEFTASKLKDAKVICLPGREVEPEVSHYLSMGVQPENIYAVEGSPRVRDEFVRNAERLGIRYFPRPLEKVLPTLDVRFDIVNYDFHGQYCAAHHRVLARTPVADDAILIYNALGKRENPQAQAALRSIEDGLTSKDEEAQTWLSIVTDPRDAGRLNRYLCPPNPSEYEARTETARLRHHCVPMAAAGWLGFCSERLNRPLMWRALEVAYSEVNFEVVREASDQELRAGITKASATYRIHAPISMTILRDLLKDDYDIRVLNGCEPIDLGLVLWHSTFGRSYWAGNGYVYDYLSETKAGAPRSPFLTTARRLKQADAVLVGHEKALDFAAAFVCEWWRLKMHPMSREDYAGGLHEVVDHRGNPKERGTKLVWNDEIRLYRRHQVVASARVADLRTAMLAATAAKRNYSLVL